MEPDDGGGQQGSMDTTDAACQPTWRNSTVESSTATGSRREGSDAELEGQTQHEATAMELDTTEGTRDRASVDAGNSNKPGTDAKPLAVDTGHSDCLRTGNDQQQPRDVAAAVMSDSGASGVAAAAAATTPRPRGWQAMLCSPRQASGQLDVLSPASGAGELQMERAHSGSSAHRLVLGIDSRGSSPQASILNGLPSPAGAAAMLDLPPATLAAAGGLGDQPAGCSLQAQQQQQQQPLPPGAAGGAAGPAAAPGPFLRAGSGPRPTVVIPVSPAAGLGLSITSSPVAYTPGGTLVRPYSGPTLCVDELDLDVIDDITAVDSAGLSSSSSPIVSGAASYGGRSTPGSHLRSSRDHDLRRAALMNHMLSPRPPTAGGSAAVSPAHHLVTAATPPGGLSIQPEGPSYVPMFTGSTRARCQQQMGGTGSTGPPSSSSLQPSPASAAGPGAAGAAEGVTTGDATIGAMWQMMQDMRATRGSSTVQHSILSPPIAAAADGDSSGGVVACGSAAGAGAGVPGLMPPPRAPLPSGLGSSRASSVANSPVPLPAHGPAAALLAGSVVPSPRTPCSPLSAPFSPGPGSSSQRALLLQNGGAVMPLPGPAFSVGFGLTGPGQPGTVAGSTPGTSPATSSAPAQPSSTASSCCNGQQGGGGGAVPLLGPMRGNLLSPPPAAGASRLGPQPMSPLRRGDSHGNLQQHEQQLQQQEVLTAEQLQQLHLRQQVQQHDTRFGPHGESPLSPASHHSSHQYHHLQQQQQRGQTLLSPQRPTSQVPPAMTALAAASASVAAAGQLFETGAADQLLAAAAAAASPEAVSVGESGRESLIHEWLDHHSWRMRPEELPFSLRDAAHLRDESAAAAAASAAASLQVQQQQQAMQQQQQQQQQQEVLSEVWPAAPVDAAPSGQQQQHPWHPGAGPSHLAPANLAYPHLQNQLQQEWEGNPQHPQQQGLQPLASQQLLQCHSWPGVGAGHQRVTRPPRQRYQHNTSTAASAAAAGSIRPQDVQQQPQISRHHRLHVERPARLAVAAAAAAAAAAGHHSVQDVGLHELDQQQQLENSCAADCISGQDLEHQHSDAGDAGPFAALPGIAAAAAAAADGPMHAGATPLQDSCRLLSPTVSSSGGGGSGSYSASSSSGCGRAAVVAPGLMTTGRGPGSSSTSSTVVAPLPSSGGHGSAHVAVSPAAGGAAGLLGMSGASPQAGTPPPQQHSSLTQLQGQGGPGAAGINGAVQGPVCTPVAVAAAGVDHPHHVLSPGRHMYPAGSPVRQGACCGSSPRNTREGEGLPLAVASTAPGTAACTAAAGSALGAPHGGGTRPLSPWQRELQGQPEHAQPHYAQQQRIDAGQQQQQPSAPHLGVLPGIERLLQRPQPQQPIAHHLCTQPVARPGADGVKWPAPAPTGDHGRLHATTNATTAASTCVACSSGQGSGGGGGDEGACLQQLLQDEGYVQHLLASLPGVDPCAAVVQGAVAQLRAGPCCQPSWQQQQQQPPP